MHGRASSLPLQRPSGPRVLIIEDHPLTQQALTGLLSEHGFDVIACRGDAAGGIAAAERWQPQLILLDLDLPDRDGLAALPQLRAAAAGVRVVVLTAAADQEMLLRALQAGVDGYLLKQDRPARLMALLQGVMEGEAPLSATAARQLLGHVRGTSPAQLPPQLAQRLSAREQQVLLLLEQHLATDQVARQLHLSPHTVRSHVKNLLAKLGVHSRREALQLLAQARSGV